MQRHKIVCYYGNMKHLTDKDYLEILELARKLAGSYRGLSTKLGQNAPTGAAMQMWVKNGVAYKWRPILEHMYGDIWRKLKTVEQKLNKEKQ